MEKEGSTTVWCRTLKEAEACLDGRVELVLLDLNLPDGSGFAFCSQVKAFDETLPVIFLTVRDDEKDIVKGLDMGADDYIVKPFLLSVLLSRVRAVLRRSTRAAEKGKLTCGDISMDTEKMKAYLGTEEVVLTAGELRLLRVLMENKNQAITRNRLLELLWDADGNFVNDNTLTVTMKRLREKMNNPKQIQTLRGIGYRMEETGRMDRREKKRTVPAVLAAAVCLGLLLGTVFAAVSSGMQRKTVEQIMSCTIKEEPELAGKVTAILKESSTASVSREGREWLDRYGYTAAYYRRGLLPVYLGISCLCFLGIFAVWLCWYKRSEKGKGQRIEELTAYLEDVNQGRETVLSRREDEFSILEDEIYKTVRELRRTKEEACQERQNLADNLADIATS